MSPKKGDADGSRARGLLRKILVEKLALPQVAMLLTAAGGVLWSTQQSVTQLEMEICHLEKSSVSREEILERLAPLIQQSTELKEIKQQLVELREDVKKLTECVYRRGY